MKRYEGIKNGVCRSNTGTKSIVFEPDTLRLRPVLYAVYSGYQPNRGTVQGALDGDLVASVTWGSRTEDYEISRFGAERVSASEEADIWLRLRARYSWLDAWLSPSGRGATWIPEEVIPESEYLSVRAKRARIAEAIGRFGLPYEVEMFARDAKGDLRLKPHPLDMDLDAYQPSEYHWDGSVVGISRYERWFGSAGDGSEAVPLDIDPEYESGSNYAHTDTVREEGSPGIVDWRRFRFVIRVCHGAHTRDHFSYGHTVDVWETPEEVRNAA